MRAGALAAELARLAGFGGAVIRGRVALLAHRDCLRELSAGRTVVLVSGTNGKNTTTALLAASLRTRCPVASNETGANMLDRLTAALACSSATVVAGEVDELHLPAAVAQTRPLVLVLLNLVRDQLDRAGEVRATVRVLRTIADDARQPWLVANCDDPNVAYVARAFTKLVWVAAGSVPEPRGVGCPACGTVLALDGVGAWCCAGCGFARPRPDWRIGAGELVDEQGQVLGRALVTPAADVIPMRLGVPGEYNYGNAAMAIAAAALIGVRPEWSAAAVAAVTDVAGRYEHYRCGRLQVQLLLAKNPAGWTAVLEMVHQRDGAVLIALHAAEADGRDTSWIYDVPFERLDGRQVLVCGRRAADVATCLTYLGGAHRMVPALRAALAELEPGPVFAIADYTSFRELRTRLRERTERGR